MEGHASFVQVMATGARGRFASDPPVRDPLEASDCLAATTRYRRGQEVYAPEDPAEHWYRVISGMARKCAIKADGRRQIVDFLLPGDFFGLITRHQHRFAVEAVTDGTEVARYPRGKIERLADFDPRVGRLIREAAFEAISRSQARMLILGRMSAQEKVGAFLMEMAERSRAGAARGLVLAMSRYDIADYLGLAAETVSRTLSDLRQGGAIRFEGAHRVRIIDPAALEDADGAPNTPDAILDRPARAWG
jgi:CRP-like cAMP-binding protein